MGMMRWLWGTGLWVFVMGLGRGVRGRGAMLGRFFCLLVVLSLSSLREMGGRCCGRRDG